MKFKLIPKDGYLSVGDTFRYKAGVYMVCANRHYYVLNLQTGQLFEMSKTLKELNGKISKYYNNVKEIR